VSSEERLRRAFVAFHLILGLALLWGSADTVLHAGPADLHARVIGTLEAVGALAFLMPRTLRVGALLLLLALGLAMAIHGARGEWRLDLLVDAAGVLLVAVHGPAYRRLHSRPAPA
jgi:hypothetical protein